MRQQLAKNSPLTIIERSKARAEDSRGVSSGAPETDRLDQLQSPAQNKQ